LGGDRITKLFTSGLSFLFHKNVLSRPKGMLVGADNRTGNAFYYTDESKILLVNDFSDDYFLPSLSPVVLSRCQGQHCK